MLSEIFRQIDEFLASGVAMLHLKTIAKNLCKKPLQNPLQKSFAKILCKIRGSSFWRKKQYKRYFDGKKLGLHTIRIWRIFSVKSTYLDQNLSHFYSEKTFLLRKTITSNSLQACCRNENCSKFTEFSIYEEICRTKSHIWHPAVKY